MSLARTLALSLRLSCKPRNLTPALERLAEGSHLYVISRARHVTIPLKKVKRDWRPWVGPRLRGTIEVSGAESFSIPFTWKTPSRRTRWVGNATDDYCWVIDEHGVVLDGGDAHVLALIATNADVRLTLHEVLYVGQSQGRSRESFSLDRLHRHSTAQEIIEREQDAHHDVFWNLLDVDESAHVGFIGSEASARAFAGVNVSALVSQALGEASEQQRRAVDLAEAALIRHFRPTYNERHKKRFPQVRTKTSSSLHSAGHTTLVMLLDTSGQGVRFGSPHVSPASLHWAAFRVRASARKDDELELACELEAHLRACYEERARAAEREPFTWTTIQPQSP